MHKVEVDDEVFAIVQQHAEPLIDDFNSALRRALALGGTNAGRARAAAETGAENGASEGFPPGTPQALRQILLVAQPVRSGTLSRGVATQWVANKLSVAPQTVIDKYTRQLGLTAARFDRLLAPERSEELRSLLHSKFPEHRDLIDRALGESGAGRLPSARDNVADIAAGIFGPEHGVELEIPPRGITPGRPQPDFSLEPDR